MTGSNFEQAFVAIIEHAQLSATHEMRDTHQRPAVAAAIGFVIQDDLGETGPNGMVVALSNVPEFWEISLSGNRPLLAGYHAPRSLVPLHIVSGDRMASLLRRVCKGVQVRLAAPMQLG